MHLYYFVLLVVVVVVVVVVVCVWVCVCMTKPTTDICSLASASQEDSEGGENRMASVSSLAYP